MLIGILTCPCAVCDPVVPALESVILTVNVEVPVGPVGVPVIAPVPELIERPAGSVPAVTAKVSVPAPPVKLRVRL